MGFVAFGQCDYEGCEAQVEAYPDDNWWDIAFEDVHAGWVTLYEDNEEKILCPEHSPYDKDWRYLAPVEYRVNSAMAKIIQEVWEPQIMEQLRQQMEFRERRANEIIAENLDLWMSTKWQPEQKTVTFQVIKGDKSDEA